MHGSVRGVPGNRHPYRDRFIKDHEIISFSASVTHWKVLIESPSIAPGAGFSEFPVQADRHISRTANNDAIEYSRAMDVIRSSDRESNAMDDARPLALLPQ